MANLPSGKILSKDADLSSLDVIKTLEELGKREFSGYVAMCIEGHGGFEEGIALFEHGKVVGCYYDYYKHGKTFEGAAAFQRFLNATAAQNGVMDVILLTPEQVQLVLAVNEKMVFSPSGGWNAPSNFSLNYEQEAIGKVEEKTTETRSDLLKKFKLGELSG